MSTPTPMPGKWHKTGEQPTPGRRLTMGDQVALGALLGDDPDDGGAGGTRTLLTILRDATIKFGHRPALKHRRPDGWEMITYSALWRRVSELGLGLRNAGVGKGDRVIIMAENAPELVLAELAVIACRALAVVLYPRYAANVLRGIVTKIAPRLCIIESGAPLARYFEAKIEGSEKIRVISYGDGVPGPRGEVRAITAVAADGRRRIERFRQEGKGNPFEQLVDRTRTTDPIAIVHSAGTTRSPRGAILTHENVVGDDLASLLGAPTPEDTALLQISLAQPFARLTALYGLLRTGATVALETDVEEDVLIDSLRKVTPTVLFLSTGALEPIQQKIKARVVAGPEIGQRLIDWALRKSRQARLEHQSRPPWLVDRLILSRIRTYLGGKLRYVYVGGAADGKALSFFQDAGIDTYEGYAIAEATPLVTLNRPETAAETRFAQGVVGKPIRGSEITADEGGEIRVRGLVNMKGYWGDDAATARVLEPDGWLRTGDVGYVSQGDFVVVQDRKADLIRLSDGSYVAPAAIEAVCKASKLVSEVVIVGRGRPFPVALVYPDFAALGKQVFAGNPELMAKATRRAILQNPASRNAVEVDIRARAAAAGLPKNARPRRVRLLSMRFSNTYELTPLGSLRRRDIERRYGPMIEALFQEALAEDASRKLTGLERRAPTLAELGLLDDETEVADFTAKSLSRKEP